MHLPKRSIANRNHKLHHSPFFYPEPGLKLPVLTAKGPLVSQYLDRAYQVFVKAKKAHCKVFVGYFTLHIPKGTDDSLEDADSNAIIRRFLDSMTSKIEADLKNKKGRHKCPVRYIVAREKSDNERLHFHVMLLLNGNVYKTTGTLDYEGQNIFWMVTGAWASALRISLEEAVTRVHVGDKDSKNSYYNLSKEDNYGGIFDAFCRASYLCKQSTKEFGNRYRGLLTSKG